MDDENAQAILNYINKDRRHGKKFNFILNLIFENKAPRELFKHEKINTVCNNVYAMRFFPGQENDRIYCVKIEKTSITYLIMCELLEKKKNLKLKTRETNIINKVARYEYQIINKPND